MSSYHHYHSNRTIPEDAEKPSATSTSSGSPTCPSCTGDERRTLRLPLMTRSITFGVLLLLLLVVVATNATSIARGDITLVVSATRTLLLRGAKGTTRTTSPDDTTSTSTKTANHHLNHHLNNSNNSNNSNKTTGVSFSRTISSLSPDTTLGIHFSPPSHCKRQDDYGDDDCHYEWGEEIDVDYFVEVSHIQFLWSSARAVGNFTIDGKLPWSFECPLCGQDCVVKVPVINLEYTYKMPKCPIIIPPTGKEANKLTFSLWDESPTRGWVSTWLEGNVVVYKNVPRNAVLANVSVSIVVR